MELHSVFNSGIETSIAMPRSQDLEDWKATAAGEPVGSLVAKLSSFQCLGTVRRATMTLIPTGFDSRGDAFAL